MIRLFCAVTLEIWRVGWIIISLGNLFGFARLITFSFVTDQILISFWFFNREWEKRQRRISCDCRSKFSFVRLLLDHLKWFSSVWPHSTTDCDVDWPNLFSFSHSYPLLTGQMNGPAFLVGGDDMLVKQLNDGTSDFAPLWDNVLR